MKYAVLYHANCTDGFGAAYAAWKALGDMDVEYIPVNYGDAPPDVTGKIVYILDFSYPKAVLEKMAEQSESVTMLDHHKTAFEDLGYPDKDDVTLCSGKLNIHLDRNRSGAMLAWDHFHGSPAPELIELIDDYDRWQFNLLSTKPVHKGLWALAPWNFQQWDALDILAVEEKGDILLKDHDKKVQQLAKDATDCLIFTQAGLAANAPSFFASDLGHVLATRSKTYGLIWNVLGNGMVQCSLRSNGDYDVSAIAKQFGGGGHKNAAGMRVDINSLIRFLCSNS